VPAVLVHGVPETPSLWDPLRAQLSRRDVVTPQLPGFGCPRPNGFGATKEEYVAWLVAELESIAAHGPVDLVGHDWGGGLTVRLVSTRPDLVRSWVSDAAGLGAPDFEWHDLAKVWQTPGDGEALFDTQLAVPASDRGPVFESLGVPHDHVSRLTSVDRTMADCILALYRSAVDVGTEWSPEFVDIEAPGAVVIAENDPFLSEASAVLAAARSGARTIRLPDRGHWWMLQDPEGGAAMLEQFWSTVS
jgi:pimeloyl-ACP methyl ester carboxylesterase